MKRNILSLAMIATFAMSSLPVLADESRNEWKASAKDAWIDGKAEATLLFNGKLNTFDINTDVRDGTVILTGKVDTEVDKALATELVESLKGVVRVDNRLTVVTPENHDDEWKSFAGELQDAKVVTVIKARLLLESKLSGGDIEVRAQQGIVTLSGKVKSESERDLAIAIAKNTDDVEDVVSELSVDS
ncbi:BON domain-containing protein [Alteromonas pelagimontana]|uniref:BON domain-containing protein n=1 Tax=Alteromonas pelagimontana TaxID=1858656 RepID=A0A6M4MBT8_9ALTE|nr:BON domain-containing protein [Alteromonas pelagimontana]QJR80672.1 BON domain-containing protein [Alteromonas pelagimontana]